MSKYTTEVRFICEEAAGLDYSTGYKNVNKIIEAARPKIFDFDYPIFDSSYKSVLETKILRHYYTREIGLETVGLWKLRLCTVLNEIMPYYNKLYLSELLEFNPLYDVDLTRDHKRDGEGTNNKSQAGESDGTTNTTTANVNNGGRNINTEDNKWDFYSDTPQGNIYDFPGESHDNDTNYMAYLTNARKNTDNGSTTETHNDTTNITGTSRTHNEVNSSETGGYSTTEDYLEHIKGKNGGKSYSALLKEYRETFLNIDMMIIKELNNLFILLW